MKKEEIDLGRKVVRHIKGILTSFLEYLDKKEELLK